MRALNITIQKGEDDNFLCGEIGERAGMSQISAGSRSQVARVIEIKTNWKRRTYQCDRSG